MIHWLSFKIALLVLSVALTLSVLLLFKHPSSASPSVLPPEQIRAIIQQARDAWVNGDAIAFANLFTADGELIVPGQRWQGRPAITLETANFLNQFTVAIEIQATLVEGNQAALMWSWQETAKDSQQTHRAEDVIWIEFEADHIRRWREYIDDQSPLA